MNEYLKLLKSPKLTLIMSLPRNDAELCAAAFDAGADVVKVHLNVHHHASGTHFGRLADELPAISEMLAHKKGPMGLVPGGSLKDAAQDLDEAAKMPFSFFSVYAHHASTAFLRCGVPLMAACDCTYSLDEAAQMEDMGASILEASIVPGDEYGTGLSFRDLLRYRALVKRTNLPVVVPTQRRVTPDDVPALIETGVSALMIGAVVTGHSREGIVGALKAFRRAIDESVSR
ncbi:MAG: hypothetical protein IJJ23_06320 [Clostridia bacterium]|nr:hypothetical protein [Clostridia bacterium]